MSGHQRMGQAPPMWSSFPSLTPCTACLFGKALILSQLQGKDFHHPERDRTWTTMGFGMRSAEAVSRELARCELLCVRCHVLERVGDRKAHPGRPRKPIDSRVAHFLALLKTE